MSQQVPKPPQERGKQDYAEPGLGQTAPTQLFFVVFFCFVFSWHEWLPDPGSPAPGPQVRCPFRPPHSRKVRSGGLSDHSAKRMRD